MNFKHGMRATRVYRIWTCMKTRCSNPNEPAFASYGGAGITVCDAWNKSFSQFYADMGDCPDGYSIERLDNSKGYEPGNCIWADRTQQNRNRRGVRSLCIRGETKLLVEWAEISGVNPRTLSTRLADGWSPEEAVFTPRVTVRKGIKRGDSLRQAFGAERGVRFSAVQGD